jgi:hypothetical protein
MHVTNISSAAVRQTPCADFMGNQRTVGEAIDQLGRTSLADLTSYDVVRVDLGGKIVPIGSLTAQEWEDARAAGATVYFTAATLTTT